MKIRNEPIQLEVDWMGFLALFLRLVHVFSFPASVVAGVRVGLF